MKKSLAVTAAAVMLLGCTAFVPETSYCNTAIIAKAEEESPALTKLTCFDELDERISNYVVVISDNGYIALQDVFSQVTSPVYIFDVNSDICAWKGNLLFYGDEQAPWSSKIAGLTDDMKLILDNKYIPPKELDSGEDWIEEMDFSLVCFDPFSGKYVESPYYGMSNRKAFSNSGNRMILADDFYSFEPDELVTFDEDGIKKIQDIEYTGSLKNVCIDTQRYMQIENNEEKISLAVHDLLSNDVILDISLNDISEDIEKNAKPAFIKDSAVLTINIPKDGGLPQYVVYCYNEKTGMLQYSYEINNDGFFSERSPYVMYGTSDDDLVFVEARSGRMAKIKTGHDDIYIDNAFCLDENRWVVFSNYSDNGENKTEVYLVDLSKADFGEVLPLNPSVKRESKVGPELEAARKRADEIEKKYGVKIVFGNEVYEYEDYWITSFEPYVDNEYKAALVSRFDMLDKRLGKFPEGFFEYFKDENGEGGLMLRYVHYVHGGVADSTTEGNWYVINGNIDCVDGFAIEHEIVHEIEMLIGKEEPFNEEEWSKLNPEGFESYDVWAPGVVHPDLYLGSDTDDPYFLTPYCMGWSVEDRAIMLGSLFENDILGAPFDGNYYIKYYNEYSQYPHLKAKYDYLAQWLKDYYGYAYWQIALGIAEMPHKGDATLDGKIDIEDAVSVMNYINGITPLKKGPLTYADANDKDGVDIEDAVAIINHVNGINSLY